LADEFAGVFSQETIARYLAESTDVLGEARINVFVPVLAHRFARERLKALAQAEGIVALGVDMAEQFPKPLTDEVVRAADVVITMGCGDACPIYPGKKYEDWELDDPAGQGLETVRRIRHELDRRVQSRSANCSLTARPPRTEREGDSGRMARAQRCLRRALRHSGRQSDTAA
jgi:arsenate reductase (thioredoxin)